MAAMVYKMQQENMPVVHLIMNVFWSSTLYVDFAKESEGVISFFFDNDLRNIDQWKWNCQNVNL